MDTEQPKSSFAYTSALAGVGATRGSTPVKYGCHVDAGDGVEPYSDCAFDSAYIHDCCLATLLHANGKGRDDCSEWKPITVNRDTAAYTASLAAENERLRASRDALAEALERIGSYDVPDAFEMIRIARAALSAAKEQP
jgi:hypothetical protein